MNMSGEMEVNQVLSKKSPYLGAEEYESATTEPRGPHTTQPHVPPAHPHTPHYTEKGSRGGWGLASRVQGPSGAGVFSRGLKSRGAQPSGVCGEACVPRAPPFCAELPLQ